MTPNEAWSQLSVPLRMRATRIEITDEHIANLRQNIRKARSKRNDAYRDLSPEERNLLDQYLKARRG